MRFAEELLLLLFDDERGDLTGTLPPGRLDILLAGAVLMDLALEERIDTDLRRVMLADPTPLDDDLLDPALADLAHASDSHDIDHWIRRQAERGGAIRERALARLAERGILVESDDGAAGFLLSRRVSRARRYHPAPDGTVQEEVRLRVMRVLFSDDIPDPRDTVIICLADAGGVLDYLLSREERAEVQRRIDLVTKLDLIGQAVTRTVREAESAASTAPPARPAHEIPCAAGLPLAGNALDLARDAEAFLLNQYRSLGPIFRVRAFGRRFVVLAGPEANLLLARGNVHFRTFEVWQRFDADVGAMRQIMSMGGGDHARLRKHQAPAYSTGLLKSRMAEVVDLVRGEVASWPENGPVAGQYMFQRLLLEQLGRLATGRSPRPYLDDLIVYLEALLRTNLHGNRPRLLLGLPHVRRARRRVMELAGRILADHDPARRAGLPPDYIDDVLALHRADPEFLPETDLPITALGPFLVGLDTASSISACMLYELLRRPDLLARVTAEADALVGSGVPVLGDLRRLDVTHRVALETMRVYPLGPAVPRVVANSFEFAGYAVPAGERVLIGIALPHRMAEHFPDPERFDIDRYTHERAEHRQPGVYTPFSAGAHSCLGRGLAEALVMLNIAVIVHETELALDPPGYTLKLMRTPSTQPDRSFRIRVKRRRGAGATP
ncbi:MAG: cytochrome P450 [Acidobacteria bacterium]|nr:cytochrome P450 [Acidobacteriota bacterium]